MTILAKKKTANKKPEQAPLPLFDTLKQMSTNLLARNNSLQLKNLSFESQKDYEQIFQFLLSYRGSEATFNAYRRELERFFQWCYLIVKLNFSQIQRDHIETFINFCQNPPHHWISLHNQPRFIDREGLRQPNPAWRPFVVNVSKKDYSQALPKKVSDYALSQSAIQAIFSILSSFFQYLVQNEYCKHNPVRLIRQKSKFLRKQHSQKMVRRLSELQWSYVIETAELLAKQNPLQHERTLFIMNALFALYLRISELAASNRWIPKMADFFCDIDGNWWFLTVGKGNKERQVSVSDAMLNALKHYRQSLGLSPFPNPKEATVLIQKNNGKGPITSTRQIRKIVQFCFDEAIIRLKNDGFLEDADRLMSATVHWLRHTGISEDVKIRPREHVRDDAGHSSGAITDRYIDVELRERHASAKNKKIIP